MEYVDKQYIRYLKDCTKANIKPLDYIDFIIEKGL